MKLIFKFTIIFLFIFIGEAFANNFSTPFQSGSTARESLQAGMAYSCSVGFDSGDYQLSLTVLSPTGEEITAVRPEVNPELLNALFSRSLEFGDDNLANNTISFVTPSGAENYGFYTITMEQTTEESRNTFLRCIPTSVQCSFNTSVNDFNFLEITNQESIASVFSYITRDFTGATTTGGGSVAAGSRSDFDIHSKVGASRFGSLVVHPLIFANPSVGFGFQGGLQARLSQYSGTNLTNTQVCEPLPFFVNFPEGDFSEVD